jgi:hypothetical protein
MLPTGAWTKPWNQRQSSQSSLTRSEDNMEAVTAFLEKAARIFSGQINVNLFRFYTI